MEPDRISELRSYLEHRLTHSANEAMLETLAEVLAEWDVLAEVLGRKVSTKLAERAYALTRETFPWLGDACISWQGIDLQSLRENIIARSPGETFELLRTLATHLIELVATFPGQVVIDRLLQQLREDGRG